jgi:hypothetical protein
LDSDGFFDSPVIYEIVDSSAGGTGVSDDFSSVSVSHGTGLLVDSCNNAVPSLESNAQSWLNAFNYPFDASSTMISIGAAVTIPAGLFREFDITAPAGDEPTGDTTGTYFPVWINRIETVGTDNDHLRFYFATHNISDVSPSVTLVEFARLDLLNTMVPSEIVAIEPIDNLLLETGSDSDLYQQHFGRGHVVLGDEWSSTSTTVDDFFTSFAILSGVDAEFTQTSTRLAPLE